MNYPWAWCQDRTTQLRKHHAAGLSFSIMAELLKTTRAAIAGKCARLKLTRPELDYAAAGRIGGKISAQKRREAKPKKRVSKFNFARPSPAITPRATAAGSSVRVSPDAPPSLNLSIIEIGANQCRYIAGDDRLCCGHPTVESGSGAYCGFHAAVCYGGGA